MAISTIFLRKVFRLSIIVDSENKFTFSAIYGILYAYGIYSTDLRKCVLDFIAKGGSKVAAERTFGISRRTIYNWLAAEDPLTAEKPGPKGPRSIDYEALQHHVADFPDKTLAERAEHFGVSINGIFYALAKLNITQKKRRQPIKNSVL